MMDQSLEGQRLLRAQLMSAWDVANEWFENEKIKIVLSRFAADAMLNPFTKGTGFPLIFLVPLFHEYGGGLAVAGSGELTEALARCIKAHGGTIKLSSTVKEFKISGDKCTGIILDSGEEILAGKAVVTTFYWQPIFRILTSFPGLLIIPTTFYHRFPGQRLMVNMSWPFGS